MAGDDGFIEHLKELFESTGPVVFRRMFGGYGLFRDGLMFGLVADNTLYLKADDENRPGFESRGLGPFVYTSARGEFSMSYYRAPEEAVDNSRDLAPWAISAFSAAERAAAGKPKKKSAKKTAPKKAATKKTAKSGIRKPAQKSAKSSTKGSTKKSAKKSAQKATSKTAGAPTAKKKAAGSNSAKSKTVKKKTTGKTRAKQPSVGARRKKK